MAEALTPDKILETAEQVLRRFGPAKTTVVDVARALGVSHGSVYRHFASKAELRDAVVERWLKRTSDPLEAIANGKAPPRERLRQWFEALIAAKRSKVTSDPEMFATSREIFAESGSLFFSLLRKVSPDINHSEFYWRASCVVGAFTFAESYTDRLTRFIDEDLSDIDWVEASNYVVRFLAAGMRAPAVSNVTRKKKPRARAA